MCSARQPMLHSDNSSCKLMQTWSWYPLRQTVPDDEVGYGPQWSLIGCFENPSRNMHEHPPRGQTYELPAIQSALKICATLLLQVNLPTWVRLTWFSSSDLNRAWTLQQESSPWWIVLLGSAPYKLNLKDTWRWREGLWPGISRQHTDTDKYPPSLSPMEANLSCLHNHQDSQVASQTKWPIATENLCSGWCSMLWFERPWHIIINMLALLGKGNKADCVFLGIRVWQYLA